MTDSFYLPKTTAHPTRDHIDAVPSGESPKYGTLPRLNALTEIIESVAAVYGVAHADIVGRARTKSIAEARMLVSLLGKRCTRLSYPELGRVLGRDHTTVMALVKSAERQRARDVWFAATAAELLERFGAEEEVTKQ
ncbi:MAG TPA: helix-turn-helix domain-containing protein [Polyangiaceae bacterium]|nr:helix-turn-helix domain-containing protein [Polyangiaceae bacterium]